MAPRKKANKNNPQPATLQEPLKAVEPEQKDTPGDNDDLSGYPEGQQNEFLTTQAIYPEGFVRVRGRKDAWKSQENLAFQVQLACLENPEIFVKLEVEFPRNYPKVQPKISILNTEPKDPKFTTQISQTITDLCRSKQGSECVYEVTAVIDEYLNRTAVSRAAKQTPFSLEEERAHRETAAQLELQRQAEAVKRQQDEQRMKDEQLLASKLVSERKRRQEASSAKAEDEMATSTITGDIHPFKFDKPMTFRDLDSAQEVSFSEVFGSSVILREPTKDIFIVSPVINSAEHRAPQFVLKHIYIQSTIAPDADVRSTMRNVESLLELSKQHRHPHVVDLYGYQILDPQQNNGVWKISILTECANKGNLAEQLDLTKTLRPETTVAWIQQLVMALAFFDQHHFIHPAVHTQNVLLFYAEGSWSVKLSDGYGTQLRDLVDLAEGRLQNSHNANYYWTPSEIRGDLRNRSSKTCVWDLGTIALKMTMGNKVTKDYFSPFQCMKETSFDNDFRRFLNSCFAEKAVGRKTAHDLLSATFFFSHNSDTTDLPTATSKALATPKRKTGSTSKWETEFVAAEKLGKGGQGSVWKAKKISDQALYAVKVLKAKNDQALEETRKEVIMLSGFRHLNIVRYYDTWVEHETPVDIDTTTTEDTGTGETWTPPKVGTDSLAPSGLNFTHNLGFTSGVRSSAVPNTGHDFMQSRLRRSRPAPAPTDDEEASDDDDDGNWLAFQAPASGDDNSDDYDNAFDQVPDPPSRPRDSSVRLQHRVDQVLSQTTIPPQKSTLFIQMELCDKRTLRHLIWPEALPSKPDLMWRTFRFILDGLQYIHEKGIIHRDLKPENIFIDEHNTPRIGDFGLATTKQAAGQDGEVGTIFYIAPELRRQSDSGTKVDMYSLGIILFEMNFEMLTGGERATILHSLSQHEHQLPPHFDQASHRIQGGVILELIDHDPRKRPEAADLIQRPDIPDPMDDAKLTRQVAKMIDSQPEKIYDRMFSRPNDEVLNRAWEHKDDDEGPDSFLYNYVGDNIRAVFHRHGAVSTSRQVVFPKVDHYDEAFKLLNENGLVLQLPYDLTLPYARSVAQQAPLYQKTYCFGTIYRKQTHAGYEPRTIPEVDFDFISYSDADLALKEAETIYVLDEILRQIPATQSRPHTILLNHIGLLDLILRTCNVRPSDMDIVKKQLSTLFIKRAGWPAIASQLHVDSNIGATIVSQIKPFSQIRGTADQVRSQLRKPLGNNYSQALTFINRLEKVVEHLNTLGMSSSVMISPLSNNSEHLYKSDVVFQCITQRTGFLIAAGGRYDALIKQYHHQSTSEPPHAVGFRLNPTDIVNYVQEDLINAESQGKLAAKAKGRAAVVPPRCEVVVTSFDPAAISTSCIECVKSLWAAGLSAEVSEVVSTMEELEERYSEEKGFWLVIVKGGGALDEKKVLKIRAPGREEYEKPAGELAGWLKVEMQRKRK